MFGKHFSSMYTGSMVGQGALMFAMMGYVIANMKPDSEVGFQVELNPVILSTILGESVQDVTSTIERLCDLDTESRTKEEDGRRLVRLGQFDYRVVNGKKYADIRNEQARREYNRDAKRRERSRKAKKSDNSTMTTEQQQEEVRTQYPREGMAPVVPHGTVEAPITKPISATRYHVQPGAPT